MLHYYAVRFFAPVLLSPFEEVKSSTAVLNVFAISDLRQSLSGTLKVHLRRWDNFEEVTKISTAINLVKTVLSFHTEYWYYYGIQAVLFKI